jgi:hypothetical protein
VRRRSENLTSNKFNDRFASFGGSDNCRQGTQHLFNQGSIVRVANSDPDDRGTVVTGSAEERKIAILGNQDRRTGKGFIPDLPIGRSQQAEVSYMNRFAAGATQSLCQRRRKLSVDEKKQNLFRRDDGMVRLAGSKGQNRVNIGAFEIRILLKDRLSRLTSR